MPPFPKSPSQTLESYTEALEVHLSNLQTRLTATLDALDELTRNHELELIEVHDRVHVLHARCQVFKARAKRAETERDELKDGVNKLVEKVEIANDHRVLPYSRIHLPDPLEPNPSQPTIRLEEDAYRDTYLSAVLSNLNAELIAEKHAFSELRGVSEARIATLEAQVARRDAELQTYKPSCSCRFSVTSERLATSSPKPNPQLAGIRLPQDQALKALDEAKIRQRTLEVEIDVLGHKLRSFQSAAQRPKLQRPAPPPPVDISAKRPPTIAQHVQPTSEIHPVLSAIDRQLVHIGIESHSLQAERDNVKLEIEANREIDGGHANKQDEQFNRILLIEEECIRLRKSERSLQRQLLLAKAAASTTEKNLNSLVDKLQLQIRKLRNPDAFNDSAPEQGRLEGVTELPDKEPLMDNASEHMTTHVEAPLLTSPLRSSTPLLQAPSALLPWTIDDNRGALAQSSYGRPPSAPPFFAQSYTQAQSQSITRLARIESELDRARNDVKTKDQAIDSLRGQLVTLQVAVQARTKRENDSNNEEKHLS